MNGTSSVTGMASITELAPCEMTEMVIKVSVMSDRDVISLLELWPDRQAVLADARAANPSLGLVAIHRWFQRRSVPSAYWSVLIAGSGNRGLGVTADDLANAHARQPTAPSLDDLRDERAA